MAGQARQRGGEAMVDAARVHFADFDVADRADAGAVGPAPPIAQAQEEGRGGHVAQGEPSRDDMVHHPAIHRFEREAPAVRKAAILDPHIAIAAIAFGAELDPAGDAVLVGRELLRHATGAVEHRSHVVAGQVAVADQDIFRRDCAAERMAALDHDGVVIGRIDPAAFDPHVAHAIKVDAVAIGIDAEPVDRQALRAGGEDGEMAALPQGEARQADVETVFERDRLVAKAAHLGRVGFQLGDLRIGHALHRQRSFARLFAPARAGAIAREADAMDHAGAQDRHFLHILAPDQAVVPMAVAEILIELVDPRFGQVVAARMAGGIGGLDHRALAQQQRHPAFEAQGEAEIAAARQQDGAAAGG